MHLIKAHGKERLEVRSYMKGVINNARLRLKNTKIEVTALFFNSAVQKAILGLIIFSFTSMFCCFISVLCVILLFLTFDKVSIHPNFQMVFFLFIKEERERIRARALGSEVLFLLQHSLINIE